MSESGLQVNLILHAHEKREGYLNLFPYPRPDEPDRVVANFANLDPFVLDSEATHFVVGDIINFLPAKEVEALIGHWISKVRCGGSIVIGGTAISEVVRKYSVGELTLSDFNLLIYGSQDDPGKFKKCMIHYKDLITALTQDHGFRLMKIKFDHDCRFIIEARKETNKDKDKERTALI